jgi:hypothetical protein
LKEFIVLSDGRPTIHHDMTQEAGALIHLYVWADDAIRPHFNRRMELCSRMDDRRGMNLRHIFSSGIHNQIGHEIRFRDKLAFHISLAGKRPHGASAKTHFRFKTDMDYRYQKPVYNQK